MTLEEAIKHCEDKEKHQTGKCALEHKQLRLWLEELKSLKEKHIEIQEPAE